MRRLQALRRVYYSLVMIAEGGGVGAVFLILLAVAIALALLARRLDIPYPVFLTIEHDLALQAARPLFQIDRRRVRRSRPRTRA